jgi:hypothetical protein
MGGPPVRRLDALSARLVGRYSLRCLRCSELSFELEFPTAGETVREGWWGFLDVHEPHGTPPGSAISLVDARASRGQALGIPGVAA